MRNLLIIATIFAASPAVACDLDYLPGFAGHSYVVGMDAEEAARAKEQAMANARAAFIKQYGLADAEAAPAAAPTEVADAAPAASVPSASMPAAYALDR
jgi:hypothetical protein